MSSQFKPIEIPPGVVSKATKKMMSSNYAEVNLVRWREGLLMPMGGMTKFSYSFASNCRRIHGWYGLDGVFRIAYLTETNLYVDVGGVLTDISPAVPLAPLPAPGSGGYGDGNYSDGTYNYNQAPPIPYSIRLDKVPNAFSLDNFGSILYAMTSADGRLLMWDPSIGVPGVVNTTPATAAFTTSSATISIASGLAWIQPGMAVYDLTNSQAIGNVLSYAGTTLTLRTNALHASAGAADSLQFSNIATIQPVSGTRGPVPTGRCFVVTPERFIMVFGASDPTNGGGPRRFAWCDQENPGAWDYASVTSQAGYLDIEPASPIITALSTRNGVLFWTGKKAYVSRFLGAPYIYNYTELGESMTPWSPQSMVNTSSMAVWMSEQGAFAFDGTSISPVACLVRPWVDNDIDPLYVRELSCAVHVENFNEVWWFFPQNGQTSNTRAIIYNYKEGWWSQARLSRSAGITGAYNAPTIMAAPANPSASPPLPPLSYKHEDNTQSANYSPDATLPFIETFGLTVTNGSRLITVKQLLPDVRGAAGNLQFRLLYRNSRANVLDPMTGLQLNSEQTTPTPPALIRPNGYVDLRATGRDIRLRIEVIGPDVHNFTLGQHQIDIAVEEIADGRASSILTACAQPPPDLPNMPDVSNTLSQYLRSFALWCRHGFADKLSASAAVPGVLLQAYDATPGTTPKVFLVQVNTAGTLVVTAQPLGVGRP